MLLDIACRCSDNRRCRLGPQDTRRYDQLHKGEAKITWPADLRI